MTSQNLVFKKKRQKIFYRNESPIFTAWCTEIFYVAIIIMESLFYNTSFYFWSQVSGTQAIKFHFLKSFFHAHHSTAQMTSTSVSYK